MFCVCELYRNSAMRMLSRALYKHLVFMAKLCTSAAAYVCESARCVVYIWNNKKPPVRSLALCYCCQLNKREPRLWKMRLFGPAARWMDGSTLRVDTQVMISFPLRWLAMLFIQNCQKYKRHFLRSQDQFFQIHIFEVWNKKKILA